MRKSVNILVLPMLCRGFQEILAFYSLLHFRLLTSFFLYLGWLVIISNAIWVFLIESGKRYCDLWNVWKLWHMFSCLYLDCLVIISRPNQNIFHLQFGAGANFKGLLSKYFCYYQHKTDYQPKCIHFVWTFGGKQFFPLSSCIKLAPLLEPSLKKLQRHGLQWCFWYKIIHRIISEKMLMEYKNKRWKVSSFFIRWLKSENRTISIFSKWNNILDKQISISPNL